ncbi:DUF6985 domain-containing protein [Anderseniella sp. Alg231-50]|uniref:DUF6985 domain-containing protein n=1 Tax=Anderseniella sp. Alg231-50 TaxID=1922226 RepID=UPI000D55A043
MMPNDLEFEAYEKLFWKTKMSMPIWDEFVGEAYASQQASAGRTDRLVEVTFAPEGRDMSPLSDDEIRSVEWLRDNHALLAEPMLKRLQDEYPALKEQYGYSKEECDQWMPAVRHLEDFKPLISLQSASVHQVSKNGIPYTGFAFDCTWDQEHGLGFLMHDRRIVDFGDTSVAFLLWIAERDVQTAAG